MAKKRTKNTNPQTPTEKELDAIKRLLILFLIKTGTSQEELALALQIERSGVSRIMPKNKIKLYDN